MAGCKGCRDVGMLCVDPWCKPRGLVLFVEVTARGWGGVGGGDGGSRRWRVVTGRVEVGEEGGRVSTLIFILIVEMGLRWVGLWDIYGPGFLELGWFIFKVW